MDTVLLRQLEGVESALNALIESVASYNPSIGAATALLAADDELHQGLKDLALHQKNHAKISRFNETIIKQNEQISSTIKVLADTRTDLLSTPTSLPPQTTRSIPYEDLLDYARRVSRFTLPPSFRPTKASLSRNDESENGAGQQHEIAAAEQQGIGLESLQQEEKQWLDPFTGTQFMPWPSEDVIRRGALGKIQGMLEKNIDPVEVVREGTEESIGFDEAKEAESTPVAADASTKVDGIKAERREEKPKVFGGLELYNPEAPDEDE